MTKTGRPPLRRHRHPAVVAHVDPERFRVIAGTIQPQPHRPAVRCGQSAPHVPTVARQPFDPVTEPLVGDGDLVIEQISEHAGMEHQPSTCGSPTIMTSTSPSTTS
jgi:hypothetical protein